MAVCEWPHCGRVLDGRNRTGRCRHHPATVPLPDTADVGPDTPDIDDPAEILTWLLQIHIDELAGARTRGVVSPQRLDYARRGILSILSHDALRPAESDTVLDLIAARLRELGGL